MTFKAARDIRAGEELTFYYGSNLWFKDAEAQLPDSETRLHEHMDDENEVLSSMAV